MHFPACLVRSILKVCRRMVVQLCFGLPKFQSINICRQSGPLPSHCPCAYHTTFSKITLPPNRPFKPEGVLLRHDIPEGGSPCFLPWRLLTFHYPVCVNSYYAGSPFWGFCPIKCPLPEFLFCAPRICDGCTRQVWESGYDHKYCFNRINRPNTLKRASYEKLSKE